MSESPPPTQQRRPVGVRARMPALRRGVTQPEATSVSRTRLAYHRNLRLLPGRMRAATPQTVRRSAYDHAKPTPGNSTLPTSSPAKAPDVRTLAPAAPSRMTSTAMRAPAPPPADRSTTSVRTAAWQRWVDRSGRQASASPLARASWRRASRSYDSASSRKSLEVRGQCPATTLDQSRNCAASSRSDCPPS